MLDILDVGGSLHPWMPSKTEPCASKPPLATWTGRLPGTPLGKLCQGVAQVSTESPLNFRLSNLRVSTPVPENIRSTAQRSGEWRYVENLSQTSRCILDQWIFSVSAQHRRKTLLTFGEKKTAAHESFANRHQSLTMRAMQHQPKISTKQ